MPDARVYSEVYAVLTALGDDYIRQTPKHLLDFFARARDVEFDVKINPALPMAMQSLSEEAIEILALLKLDYWCRSAEEKEALRALLQQNEQVQKEGRSVGSASEKLQSVFREISASLLDIKK